MAGVAACMPGKCLPALLNSDHVSGQTILLGAGKAAGEMAAVVVRELPFPVSGIVVTRHGHGPAEPVKGVKIIEAGHPVPDDSSLAAALEILMLAQGAGGDDHIIFLISGGGSSLLSCPADGLDVKEKRAINRALVASGATIHEINTVRANLSKVKGGRLATAGLPARMTTYIISDVVGDDPAVVASGPTIARQTEPGAVRDILARYDIPLSASIERILENITPLPDIQHPVHVIATGGDALRAASDFLENEGWTSINLGAGFDGDATATARAHGERVLSHLSAGEKVALLSGGELTVRVCNPNGRGGPNLEYLTSLMLTLGGAKGVSAIAIDTDGIDGSEDNAGGMIDETSLQRAAAAELDVRDHLALNITYNLFRALGDLVITGPTRTNVNDLRIILVEPSDD